MTPLIAFIIGALVGGVACAVSAKVFGWFQKETKSAESKLP
jgi:hypothetical protein